MSNGGRSTRDARATHARLVRGHLWWIYLIFGAIVIALYEFVSPLKGSGPALNLVGLSAILAVVGGVKLHRPREKLAWQCFAVGLGLYWGGDFVTYTYPKLAGIALPFPSVADALYLSTYPVLMTGLLVLVRSRNRHSDGVGLADALVISLGLALIPTTQLIAPYLHDHAMTLLPKLVSVAYPVGDIALLGAGIRLAVDTGKRRPSFYLIVASITMLLISDFVYARLTQRGDYHYQLWLNVGWMAYNVLWGAGALHPSMRTLSDAGVERAPRLGAGRLSMLAAAAFIAPVLGFLHALHRHDGIRVFVAAASIVIFSLVVARMAGLVRQRERLAGRERSLSTGGEELVAATSPAEIEAAGLRAAETIAGETMRACLCRQVDGALRVVALAAGDALTSWTVSATVGDRLAELAAGRPGMIPAEVSDVLRFHVGRRAAVCLDLPVQTTARGWLLVAGRLPPDVESRASLRVLAHQVALALERADLSEQIHRDASEARFASLVAHSSDLITVIDVTNAITYQSPSIETVLGHDAQEMIGRSFTELLHPTEHGRLRRCLLEDAWSREAGEPIQCVLAMRDGQPRHFEILLNDLRADEHVRGIVLNARDVSERWAFEEQLAHQAFHDSVTHLPNRALFSERVRHAVGRAAREPLGLAAIFVDLDDFKTINDSLGHAAGDEVLLEVAKRLSAAVRTGDTPARFGGDEFAVLLEDVPNVQGAADAAERILQSLAEPFQVAHTTLTVHASLGISIVEAGGLVGADELIRNADAAMYIAKAEGKGGYRIFEPAMHERVLSRLRLRADLERALTDGEFELHYQPLVRLADQAVTGIEALVRWRHPERGLIPPDEFIPFAEESGMIVALGRWVLREGCRQAKELRRQLSTGVLPSVGINLSVKQLFDRDIVADVVSALRDADLEASALTLEITESVMMVDTALATARLGELHALGVQLALDDFGTGYSSLSYLSQFPLDILKMDRSLLASGAAPITSGLASAVLGLGDTFGLEVVAEGIEHAEQASVLRELGCETGQGFYFARPLPPEQLLAFLTQGAPVEPPVVTGIRLAPLP